jgi:hypothetical protein
MADPLLFLRSTYAPIGPEPEIRAFVVACENRSRLREYFSEAAANVIRNSPTSSL